MGREICIFENWSKRGATSLNFLRFLVKSLWVFNLFWNILISLDAGNGPGGTLGMWMFHCQYRNSLYHLGWALEWPSEAIWADPSPVSNAAQFQGLWNLPKGDSDAKCPEGSWLLACHFLHLTLLLPALSGHPTGPLHMLWAISVMLNFLSLALGIFLS